VRIYRIFAYRCPKHHGCAYARGTRSRGKQRRGREHWHRSCTGQRRLADGGFQADSRGLRAVACCAAHAPGTRNIPPHPPLAGTTCSRQVSRARLSLKHVSRFISRRLACDALLLNTYRSTFSVTTCRAHDSHTAPASLSHPAALANMRRRLINKA